MSFYNFFFEISQTSELKSTTETFSASTSFIHFDGLCNYLHSFQKQPAANFFKNNCCCPDHEHVGHYINKSTETGLDLSIKYIYGPFNADFAAVKVSLVIIISSSDSGNSSSCSRSGGDSGSGSDSTSGCGSSRIMTCTGGQTQIGGHR